MLDRYQESWFESLILSIAALWFIMGMVAPAPVFPFGFVKLIGWHLAVAVSVIFTALWLGVPFLLFKWAEKIRDKRINQNF